MDSRIINNVLSAAGLAIKTGGSALFKTGNTIRVKVNGMISAAKTTADAPALDTALGVGGAATTNLEDGMSRVYTLLASVNETTGAVTFSLVHGADFSNSRLMKTSDINFGNAGDESKAVVGFAYVKNASGADFVPGTTALDASNVTVAYIEGFGFVGM